MTPHDQDPALGDDGDRTAAGRDRAGAGPADGSSPGSGRNRLWLAAGVVLLVYAASAVVRKLATGLDWRASFPGTSLWTALGSAVLWELGGVLARFLRDPVDRQ